MPQKTLVLDGLWHCLCPSFSLNILNRSRISIARGNTPRTSHLSAISRGSISAPRRCLSNHLDRPVPKPGAGNQNIILDHEDSNPTSDYKAPEQNARRRKNADSHPVKERFAATHTLRPSPKVPMNVDRKSTSDLEAKLQEISTKNPQVVNTTQILRVLIRDRHVPPAVRHYRALILANSDARYGSPEVIRELIDEMEANGIPADSVTLHAALQVLAVHPDYVLRQEIICTLRDRWLPLSPTGWHFVVAGLLREHQFELAIDHLAQMERKGIPIENWLHSLLIYYLCDFEEFDEVVRLMRSRANQGHNMTLDLWQHVLTVASTAIHTETTWYVWKHMVELKYLHPSHEICSGVLTVASLTGDAELAASVVRYLMEMGSPLNLGDYEKIAKAHIVSGDLSSGIEIFCKMHKAGIPLEQSSTDIISTHLISNKFNPRDAWAILKRLRGLGHDIPLCCALAVLQICEHGALNDPFMVDDGIALYKELYALSPEKADASIYNTLIGMCRRAKTTDAVMFVLKEMASLGVLPNATTFEHLIVMCLEAENFESAYMYLQDLLDRGFPLSEEVCSKIQDLCSSSTNIHAQHLRDHPQVKDETTSRLRDQEGPRPVSSFLLTKVYSDSPPHANRLREIPEIPVRRPWMHVSKEDRRAESKERRKRKRRHLAIAKNRDEEGWMDYEPGGLIPEDQMETDKKKPDN